jgi:hypothetical protein
VTGQQAVAAAFALPMVGLVTVGSHGPALGTGAAALLAVGVGVVSRPAATLAVLLAVATVVLAGPAPAFVALSGLCAAAYLVCRYSPGPLAVSWPTAIGAVGFTFVGLVATAFPLRLPWLPLAAPLVALAIYVVAARPFVNTR